MTNNDNDHTKYVSTQRVAEMFGVTTETVRNWIDRGDLEAIQITGRWRVSWDSAIELAHRDHGGTPK